MDEMRVLDLPGLQGLIDVLGVRGYAVVGPTVHHAAIVSAPLTSVDDLPRGWGDEPHDDGHQHDHSIGLRRRGDDALFGYTASAQDPRADGVDDWAGLRAANPLALFGVRPCDLNISTRHEPGPSARHAAHSAAAFVVAVTCSDPRATCVCALTGAGPHPTGGYDLALTELLDDGPHRFLVQVGSTRGAGVLAEVPTSAALAADVQAAQDVAAGSVAQMGRQLDSTGLRDELKVDVKSSRWDDVSSRCLACTLAVVRIARGRVRNRPPTS